MGPGALKGLITALSSPGAAWRARFLAGWRCRHALASLLPAAAGAVPDLVVTAGGRRPAPLGTPCWVAASPRPPSVPP